jgi:hypothetical protein
MNYLNVFRDALNLILHGPDSTFPVAEDVIKNNRLIYTGETANLHFR